MVELRWIEYEKPVQWDALGNPVTSTVVKNLQYRNLFYPFMIASGDIVLKPEENPEWIDVPTVKEE